MIKKMNEVSNLKVIRISNKIYNLSSSLYNYKQELKIFVRLFYYLGFVIFKHIDNIDS